jgi:hypothetical protein
MFAQQYTVANRGAIRATAHRPNIGGRQVSQMTGLSRFLTIAMLASSGTMAKADLPEAIAAPNAKLIATVHAEGAQIYECKADAGNTLVWQFREPIATLLVDGKTVGRHFAGPGWEFADGSMVMAKPAGRAPGATAKDIPLLKLAVTARRGNGQLTPVTTIQRLNTLGGTLEGACDKAGALMSMPYAADYTFLQEPH